MKKKLLALLLALCMCFSLTSAFAEEIEPQSEEEVVVPEVIEVSIDSDEVYTLNENKINNVCTDVTGKRLEYILIDVEGLSDSDGVLWYNYHSSSAKQITSTKDKYYKESERVSSSKLIRNVTFVPKTDTYEVEINYTAYSIKENSKYETFDGKIKISVTKTENSGDIDTVKIDTKKGGKYKFNIDDFERAFKNAGVEMNYIQFELPDEANGTLLYNYSATSTSSSYNKTVSESSEYYLDPRSGDLAFDKVTLVIERTAASKFDLNYTVYDNDDNIYNGVVTFVLETDDDYDTTYETYGENIFLRASDFNDECIDNTGYRLRYVKFSKPTYGTLWYDYDDEEDNRSTASTSKAYYYESEPYLYLISYVPKDNYKGTVYVDYTATSISNEKYSGTITIKVNTSNVDKADTITYSVKNNSYKTFTASAFEDVCDELTNESLEYVKFSAPSKGDLYYRYDKSDEYQISSSDKIYFSSSDGDSLNYVSYVPQKNSTGTVTISYTGMTTEETTFRGDIKITVKSSTSSSGSSSYDDDDDYYYDDDDEVDYIKYSGTVGKEVKFSKNDFNEVCSDYADDTLDYVVFTVTSSSVGTLYYDYDGSDEEKISSSDKCYYKGDDPLISGLSFIPKKSGTIQIKYRAYPEDEDDYVGYIKITVKNSYTYDDDDDDDYDYDYDYDDDYDKITNNSDNMSNFIKSKSYSTGIFSDVNENEWYGANSSGVIKTAYAYGLMQGRANGTFDPNGSITIAEAITIASRISDIYYADNTDFGVGNTNWYDGYIDYAIQYNIIKDSQFSNYNVRITREEMAMVFSNVLPKKAMEEINAIDSIIDVDENNQYFNEILHLYRAGVLLGDTTGAFNPKNYITRAEVSAIITRMVDVNERLRK